MSRSHGGGASLIIQAKRIKSPYDDNKNNDHILKLIERIPSKGHLSTNNGRRIRRRGSIHDPCITIIILQCRGDDSNKDGRCRQDVKTTPLFFFFFLLLLLLFIEDDEGKIVRRKRYKRRRRFAQSVAPSPRQGSRCSTYL